MACYVAWQPMLFLALLVALCSGILVTPDHIERSLLSSYDFVVVGAGTAGIVVATRLSEDANITVLLLEAGQLDTEGRTVTIPGLIGDDLYTTYDWNLTTVRQEYLDNLTRPYNSGRVVGGSSVLNGLVWTRASSADYDAWQALGNPGWGWNDLLPWFKKSETYSVNLSANDSSRLHVEPEWSKHGTDGPVEVTYPEWVYASSYNFLYGLSNMSVELLADANDGISAGAVFIPSSLCGSNQSRADSRTAYLDTVIDRPNLHVAVEQTATRLILRNGTVDHAWQQLIRAQGVEFASLANATRYRVNATRDVILAAGAVFSPTLLQMSGIGPASVLQSLDVDVLVNLPGVGSNLQDHPMVGVDYNFTNTYVFTANNLSDQATFEAALEKYNDNRTGPLTAPLVSAIAFPPLNVFLPWQEMIANASGPTSNTSLPLDTDLAVRLGYAAQRALQIVLLQRSNVGAFEIMSGTNGLLTVANVKPLSRGTVRPASSNIFDSEPLIDPRYCADPYDCRVLLEALRFNDRLIHTAQMQALKPSPAAPFVQPWITAPENETDVMREVKQRLATEFHPCGTAAMMPRQLGGVVDPQLRVWGTENVRVVDASIFPIIPSAHIQATVYAVAERAADMIKYADAYGNFTSAWHNESAPRGRKISDMTRM